MKKYSAILLGSLMVLSTVFTSCEAVKNTNNTQRGAAIGAAGGAILGAVLGNNLGKGGNGAMGAVLGGVVGGVAGVGLVNGRKNLQWLFLLRVCIGWVVVFFSAMNPFAGLFAFVSFSPTFM